MLSSSVSFDSDPLSLCTISDDFLPLTFRLEPAFALSLEALEVVSLADCLAPSFWVDFDATGSCSYIS
jgi:hypothetical protein